MTRKLLPGIVLILSLLSGCDTWLGSTKIMSCPKPGQEGKVKIVKLEAKKLYYRLGSWKPQPGYYSDGSWIFEMTSVAWKRTDIFDFKFQTYTLQYQSVPGGNLLKPSLLKDNGTYHCTKIK